MTFPNYTLFFSSTCYNPNVLATPAKRPVMENSTAHFGETTPAQMLQVSAHTKSQQHPSDPLRSSRSIRASCSRASERRRGKIATANKR